MPLEYIRDKTIDLNVFAHQTFEIAEYENCAFKNLDLGSNILSGCIFSDCTFEECNLSLCQLKNTSFKTVRFNHCKMLGLRWDECKPFLFAVGFLHCILDMNNFYSVNLKKTNFSSCSLVETDFSQADMSFVHMDDCELKNAVFDHTNLQYADFTTSRQYIIDPEKNNIKKASFSWPALVGLLTKYDIKVQ